jgi:hypothetical protein
VIQTKVDQYEVGRQIPEFPGACEAIVPAICISEVMSEIRHQGSAPLHLENATVIRLQPPVRWIRPGPAEFWVLVTGKDVRRIDCAVPSRRTARSEHDEPASKNTQQDDAQENLRPAKKELLTVLPLA